MMSYKVETFCLVSYDKLFYTAAFKLRERLVLNLRNLTVTIVVVSELSDIHSIEIFVNLLKNISISISIELSLTIFHHIFIN